MCVSDTTPLGARIPRPPTGCDYVTKKFPALLRPLGILAVAIAIAAFMVAGKEELVARSVDKPLPLVTVQTIAMDTLPVTVVAYGNVAAWRQLALTAQVTGRILWQSERFEPGVVVKAGEPLLRIDDTDYQLALAEARQALASAELSLADAKSLRQAARVDEAEAAVNAARARITRAQRDLENTEILAPYNAVIDEQQVEVGQFVTTGMQLGRILGSDRAELRLPVTQQDIAFIDATSTAPVLLSSTVGPRDLTWQGRITRIEARVDDQTRVFPVVITIDDPLDTSVHASPLPFGLFVRAEIAGRGVPGAVRVPQSALHGESDVFLLLDGELRRRTVMVERINEGQALITDGLEDGDRVVTTRLDLMFEGMQVDLISD